MYTHNTSYETPYLNKQKLGDQDPEGAQPSASFIFFKIMFGWHSNKSTMLPGMHQEIMSRNNIPEHSERIRAHNSDAVLAVVVKNHK